MKGRKYISIIFMVLFLQIIVSAQTELPREASGDYATVTILNLINKADSSSSKVYKVPYNVTQFVFEAVSDTITTADSLIIMLQGSPTGKNDGPWFTYLTWRTGTGGEINKQTVATVDRYVRAVYQCKGSAISNDFRCYLTPKR